MSATHASPLPNKTSQYEDVDAVEGNWHLLFGLSFAIATVTCLGGLYSLMSLLRMRSKSSLCLIVASLSIDDLISVVPLTLFMILQWRSGDANRSGAMCTLSGLLYVFQGLSSNMKACLIVAYTFYVTKRFGVHQTPNRPLGVFVAVVAVWTLSLAVSVLPVCGWGRFAPASLGCLPENDSLYALLLFSVYSLCFCGLVVCSVPLVYHLMCSTEALRTFYPGYFEIAGSAPLCEIPSLSRDSLEKSLGAYNELNSNAGSFKNKTETYSLSYSPATGHFQKDGAQSARHSPVFFSQKRFSMILAMARMVLWMPMMTQILVSHAVHIHSSSLETLCFFLTLLSSVVTPVFVLSERWIHLPCGCFINCRQGLRSEISTAKKRRFEFNLSFQQSYGIYKIPHAKSPSIEKPSFNSLYSCDFSESRVAVLDSGQIGKFSTTAAEDSSLHGELLLEERVDSQPQNATEKERPCNVSPQISTCDREDLHLDNSSVFDGPERRLSHEECRKIELTDWEWCRSKSERTPRQLQVSCACSGPTQLQVSCVSNDPTQPHFPTSSKKTASPSAQPLLAPSAPSQLILTSNSDPSRFFQSPDPRIPWLRLGLPSPKLQLHFVPPPLWLRKALPSPALPWSSVTLASPQSSGTLAPTRLLVTTPPPWLPGPTCHLASSTLQLRLGLHHHDSTSVGQISASILVPLHCVSLSWL
ncbi:putative G-protein coupled receptor 149 [Anabarilius grahami]|uniref:Putative G-protein coupled receptor 149 n=1 Tax=Anabarilius grahami TaxID=495550 RepID=A0A3N0Y7S1_ANAGA|nr:putative G-protein coupled receptor 149 [Anabarilius grahami]